MTTLDPQVAALLKDSDALIPAIVQDSTSKEVLMLAYMNAQSLELTLTTGKATYWSRSRNELWVKGATSGHYQDVQSIALDCDGDALVRNHAMPVHIVWDMICHHHSHPRSALWCVCGNHCQQMLFSDTSVLRFTGPRPVRWWSSDGISHHVCLS